MKNLIIGAFMSLMSACASPVMAQVVEWDTKAMNEHIDETNFIVGNHCSATLISVKERLLLTNHHCVDQYLNTQTRQVVDEKGRVNDVEYETKKDVPVSQRQYTGHIEVGNQSYSTVIVAYDESVDLGLLQFRLEKIPNKIHSEIWTGDKPLRGDTVYAVGNPLGLDATLTKGVISSMNRRIKVGGEEKDYLQMDAGIAGGNSGGALYNVTGQLIGVPAASARGTMIGLSIPYTSIQTFLEEACYASVYDTEALDHDACVEAKEEVE